MISGFMRKATLQEYLEGFQRGMEARPMNKEELWFNYTLIEAIIALDRMTQRCDDPDNEVERCLRYLDAMVPPLRRPKAETTAE
jgi:hypothetical protein